MKEVFKDIKDYEGLYAISNKGRVKSFSMKKQNSDNFMKTYIDLKGYTRVELTKNGKGKKIPIHRLIAQAFIGDITKKIVHHKDENKQNNNPKNLEIIEESYHNSFHHTGDRHHLFGKNSTYKGVHPSARKVICVETGVVYESIKQAEKLTQTKHISCCCNNKRKIANKLHWKFVEEEKNVS